MDVSSNFPRQDLHSKKIQDSVEDQRRFKDWIMTSDKFSQIERDAISCNTVEKFRTYWVGTNRAYADFESRHLKGRGLWGRHSQTLAVLFQEFMEEFCPIVDVVTAFAPPFGGIVVGTISILFAVRSIALQFHIGEFVLTVDSGGGE